MRPCATCASTFRPDRPHHRVCWTCFRRAVGPPPFDAATWARVLDLTHPDRHPDLAVEATEVAQLVADQLDLARAAERERVAR